MDKPKKEKPQIIKDVGFDFHWSTKKVWALNLPIEEISIKELLWHFDIPFWWSEGGYYDEKPWSSIQNPKDYPKRYERIMNTDLTYPLDIMFWRGRWLLLDGLHRLAKHYISGNKTVKVRKVPAEDIENIKPDYTNK